MLDRFGIARFSVRNVFIGGLSRGPYLSKESESRSEAEVLEGPADLVLQGDAEARLTKVPQIIWTLDRK